MNLIYPFTTSFLDYPDNSSLCISIYIMGCTNNCFNCQNPQFANHEYISENTKKLNIFEIKKEIEIFAKRAQTNKICLMGGDPLSSFNINETRNLLIMLKEFSVCIYTGHTIDYVKKTNISNFKYLKCGSYIEELKQMPQKDNDRIIFASNNQELYDSNFNLISISGIILIFEHWQFNLSNILYVSGINLILVYEQSNTFNFVKVFGNSLIFVLLIYNFVKLYNVSGI